MVWGTQQTNLFPGAKVDGVFSMWYGKGPGVDRCGDVFKHGNAAGTSRMAACWRWPPTTTPAAPPPCRTARNWNSSRAMMPVLNPAGVQDILDMGLLGWAMSRFTGRWVGFKTIAETVESSASVNVNPHQLDIVLPDRFRDARRRPQHPLAGSAAGPGNAPASLRGRRAGVCARQPHRPHRDRLAANARWASSPPARAISTCCRRSNTSASMTRTPPRIGIRVYKVGMTWPLEPVGIRDFARGLEDILVVEEKRSFIESQIKDTCYNWPTARASSASTTKQGEWILPSTGELTPATHRRRHRQAPAALPRQRAIESARCCAGWKARKPSWPCRAPTSRACRITARAARTTPAPRCRKARARWAASAATTW
jgi:indolepyruvate ferredoxin oxidoreductase